MVEKHFKYETKCKFLLKFGNLGVLNNNYKKKVNI